MASVNFNLQGSMRGITLSVEQVTGIKGAGFHRLHFSSQIDCPADWSQAGTIFGVAIDVTVGGLPLGRATMLPHQFPKDIQGSGQIGSSFYLDLDNARLEAIERIRNSGNLQLQLNVALGLGALPNYPAGVIVNQGSQMAVEIPRSVWIDNVLTKFEYQRYILIEVPVASADSDPLLAEAAAQIDECRQLLIHGYDQQTVAKCRDVVESVTKSVGFSLSEEAKLARFASASLANAKTLDKAGRLAVLRWATRLLTSAAHHEEEGTSPMEWGRHGALAAITASAALIEATYSPKARDLAESRSTLARASDRAQGGPAQTTVDEPTAPDGPPSHP